MRTIKLILAATFLAVSTFTFAGTTPITAFSGEWVNVKSNTRGLTKMIIRNVNSGRSTVRAFGQCSPRDCDWGTVNGTYFYTAGYDRISANYKIGGKSRQIVMRKQGKLIIASVHIFDKNGKATTNQYTMKKVAPIDAFTGVWVNVKSNTKGLTKMIIRNVNSGRSTVRSFGQCSPRDCDWGTVNGTFFNTAGYDRISANYKIGGKSRQIVMRKQGDLIIASVHIFDKNGKATTNQYTMKRK